MKPIQSHNLALSRLGLKLLDSDTEKTYRIWRRDQAIVLMIIGGCVALSGWLFAALVTYFWLPEYFPQAGPPIFGMVVPAFVFLLTLGPTKLFRNFLPLGVAICMVLTGGVLLWLFISLFTPENGVEMALMCAVSALILNNFFAPVMQLTPPLALLATFPTLGVAILLATNGFITGQIALNIFVAQITLSALTLGTVIVLCALMERNARQAFVNDQVIDEQRRTLEKSAALVRRYAPPKVAEQIFSGNESSIDTPQRRRVTVLFSDIVGFTNMADRLDAESMTQILNEYMAAMAEIVEAHDGTLNEFAGDGLMALFGAPNNMEPQSQVFNAVKAAEEMQEKLPELNKGWSKLGIGDPLKIRIGINTGVLSVGSFGSQGRMTYTAIGLQTNIAARLQSHCEPGSILISDASYHLIDDVIKCEFKGEVECKGVHFPVKVHTPIH